MRGSENRANFVPVTLPFQPEATLCELHSMRSCLRLQTPFGVTLERSVAAPLAPPHRLEATPRRSADAGPGRAADRRRRLVPSAAAVTVHLVARPSGRVGNYSLAQRPPDDAQVLFHVTNQVRDGGSEVLSRD